MRSLGKGTRGSSVWDPEMRGGAEGAGSGAEACRDGQGRIELSR